MSSESEGRGSTELQERFRRLQVIYRMTVALSQADDVDELCDQALRGLQQALEGSSAALLIWEEGSGFRLYAWKGPRERWTSVVECVRALIDENAGALFVADVSADSQISAFRRAILAQGIGAFAFIPLQYQRQLLGGVILRYDSPHTFSDEEITVSGALTGHMALALARKRDERLLKAAHDELEERIERRTAQLKDEILQRKKAELRLREESARVRLLQEIAAFANEADSFKDALHFTLDKVCEFTKWPVGQVYILDEINGERLATERLWYCDDLEGYKSFRQEREALSVDPIRAWLGKISGSDEPDWVSRVTERGFAPIDPPHSSGIACAFSFPVVVDSDVVAVLEFFARRPIEPDSDLLEALQFVATQLARVIERERAANALQESEAMLAEAQRLAHIGSWEWDIETNNVSWSDELYHIYGVQPDEFDPNYENYLQLIHPEDREQMDRVIQQAYQNCEPFEQHHRIIRPDGVVRILHARGNPILNESGEMVRMHGTGQDVTERKHTERQLEHRAQQLAALHEVALTVASSLDLDIILERVLDTLRPLLDAEGVFVLLYEGDEHLVFAAANEVGVGNLTGQRVPASRGVAGEVLRTGQIQWVYGDETAERVYHELEQVAHYHPRAIMAAPLKLRGELIGVLEAVHTDSGAFGEEDIRIIETAANWTAIAIGNARLYQAQQEGRRTAETLRAANTTLSQTLNLQTILDTLLDYASALIGFERAVIFLLHRDGRLRARSFRGFDQIEPGSSTLSATRLPEFERLLQDRTTVLLEEAAGDQEHDAVEPEWRPQRGEMGLAVPLLSGERVVGILVMYATAGQYSERHATLAEALAAQASVAVQNARLFAQVQAGRERLRHLSKQVVSAQEEERQRVARELHDEAGQALTALKISLEMIKGTWSDMPEPVFRQLDEAIVMTDQTMEQIRLLAHDLRPPVLDTFGLTASLEGIVRDFGRRTDLEIEFTGAQLSDMPEAATISFYRFVQEALTNIARHADASKVQVELRDDGDKIMVVVTDNGNGFHVEEKVNVEEPRGGIGLSGMQDRFDLLNGWVEIESAPGQGTRVAAFVPRQEER